MKKILFLLLPILLCSKVTAAIDTAPLSNSDSSTWSSYSPGLWEQDIYTLPLEALLGFMATQYYTSRARPLWPYQAEVNDKSKKTSQLPGRKLVPFAAIITAGTLGGLHFSNEQFKLLPHIRGWLHAVLLTELATTSTKVMIQRHRPFYDSIHKNGDAISNDDRFSFFSGHASQAFSFATYSSALIFTYTENPWIKWPFTVASYGVATWVASTRVTGNQHHIDDVVVGAIAGTLITGLVFLRVEDVISKYYKNTNIQITPTVQVTPTNRLGASLNLEISL